MGKSINVSFSVNRGQIADAILDAVVSQLRNIVRDSLTSIQSRISDEVRRVVVNTPEYESLRDGDLFHQLGVLHSDQALESIIKAIQGSVRVTEIPISRLGTALTGGIRIEILKEDFSEVLGLGDVSFTSEGGFDIPWLEWLLLEGDRIIIADYDFVDRSWTADKSRTGLGLMVGHHLPGGTRNGWKVPPEYAGTAEDNWLTRALAGIEKVVVPIIEEELSRRG